MYKVSILTIGDEILLGDIINTNAAWIGEQVAMTGAKVVSHSTIGDSREVMLAELDGLGELSDLVLITGGLGPTHDDITKKVLSDYFDDKYIQNEEVYQNVKNLIESRGRTLKEKHKEQALVPSKATIFINEAGTAPGMYLQNEKAGFISMPGVPSEMKFLMNKYVLPIINQKVEEQPNIHKFRLVRTYGIPESVLDEILGNPDDFLGDCTLAFLPSYHGVRLRIGIESSTVDEANEKLDKVQGYIVSKAEKHIYGFGKDKLHVRLSHILRERKLTISAAESCTGGMFGALFTDLPGSSNIYNGGIISYSNQAKIDLLDVKEETLAKFGAVSEETAREMAHNCRIMLKSDFAISITGIAGPDGGTPEKPVGLVYIGLACETETIVRKFRFGKNREQNRDLSVGSALTMLFDKLKEMK